jgi:hypothetical protein
MRCVDHRCVEFVSVTPFAPLTTRTEEVTGPPILIAEVPVGVDRRVDDEVSPPVVVAVPAFEPVVEVVGPAVAGVAGFTTIGAAAPVEPAVASPAPSEVPGAVAMAGVGTADVIPAAMVAPDPTVGPTVPVASRSELFAVVAEPFVVDPALVGPELTAAVVPAPTPLVAPAPALPVDPAGEDEERGSAAARIPPSAEAAAFIAWPFVIATRPVTGSVTATT